MSVRYLLGAADGTPFEDLLDRCATAPAWAPFDARATAFVARFSQRLLTHTQARQFPEMAALGHWFRGASLRDLSAQYPTRPGLLRLGRGLAFHVAPANVDSVFMYSWLLSLLAGNANLVRVSQKGSPQQGFVIDALRATLAEPVGEAVAGRFVLLTYPHDDAITRAISARCQLRVVWGGDTTVATLRDAIDPSAKAGLMRVRPPRFIDWRTRKLKVYSYVESLGEERVAKLRGGKYRLDGYVGHVDVKQHCLLVTRRRILLLKVQQGGGAHQLPHDHHPHPAYDVVWELRCDQVLLVQCNAAHDTIAFYFLDPSDDDAAAPSLGKRRPLPRGMLLAKHVVVLPENKLRFVRAMLLRQESSVLTQMSVAGAATGRKKRKQADVGGGGVTTPTARSARNNPIAAVAGFQYPLFRMTASAVSPLTRTRTTAAHSVDLDDGSSGGSSGGLMQD